MCIGLDEDYYGGASDGRGCVGHSTTYFSSQKVGLVTDGHNGVV